MVDAVLAETGAVQQRVRDLPSRVVVYLLLAARVVRRSGLRPGVGADDRRAGRACRWRSRPRAALAQARRRIGVAPLRALFDLLRGPAAGLSVKGVRWRGRLVTAIDGTILGCPDTPANLRGLPARRRLPGRHRLPAGPGAGAGGLRHPHDHRRDLRHRPDRGDQLRPRSARRAAPRDDRAGRPQLRRPRPARRGRRHRRRPAGPGQDRTQAPGLSPAGRRQLPVPDRRGSRSASSPPRSPWRPTPGAAARSTG